MGNVVALANYIDRPRADVLTDYIRPVEAWAEGWARFKMCDHQREVAWWAYRLAEAIHGKNSLEAIQARRYRVTVERAWEHEAVKLLFVAAPAVRFLRWKERIATGNRWCPEVEAALERDRQAFAHRIEGQRKAAATRRGRKAVHS
ncbi:hypothetical protein [Aminobacter niigataensis]|uniref:hypothetical protein n=1 Tax=Aminobacter niigataensis TaxID=83265 RepID=UPI0024C63BA5|nr:hypothetical protein [Aminobacter niigataensis]CAI2932471.1 conserved protein of unknown function [Aminobacter niigataensis]